MPAMKIAEEWTYRTPLVTVTYAAGGHTVDNETLAAAIAAGVVTGKNNGNGGAKAGEADDTGEAQG